MGSYARTARRRMRRELGIVETPKRKRRPIDLFPARQLSQHELEEGVDPILTAAAAAMQRSRDHHVNSSKRGG